jgi:hypothetical protein
MVLHFGEAGSEGLRNKGMRNKGMRNKGMRDKGMRDKGMKGGKREGERQEEVESQRSRVQGQSASRKGRKGEASLAGRADYPYLAI